MTKVRGSKGFDALFSRVFDEPGLKDAVDSLHAGFAHTDHEPPSPPPKTALESVVVPDPILSPVIVEASKPVSVKKPVVTIVSSPPPAATKPSAKPTKKSDHASGQSVGQSIER